MIFQDDEQAVHEVQLVQRVANVQDDFPAVPFSAVSVPGQGTALILVQMGRYSAPFLDERQDGSVPERSKMPS